MDTASRGSSCPRHSLDDPDIFVAVCRRCPALSSLCSEIFLIMMMMMVKILNQYIDMGVLETSKPKLS